MVNAALENYNYYNDSRVQAAMFSTCWKVVHQEAHEAIIAFDEEWLTTSIFEVNVEAAVQKWVDDEVDFTQHYRKLDAISAEKRSVHEKAHKKLHDEYPGYWDSPKEDRDALAPLLDEWNAAGRAARDEWAKLYDRALAENPFEDYAKEMGMKSYRKGGEEHLYCLSVRTLFEVCGLCQGSGKVTNPSIDCCGISQEDFDDDPDFEEEYFSGRYDQQCPTCRGNRVQAIPQFPKWLNKAIESYEDGQWEHIRESCTERAMGA